MGGWRQQEIVTPTLPNKASRRETKEKKERWININNQTELGLQK